MHRILAATIAATVALAAPAFASPAGTYLISGTNPGGEGNYKGSVTVVPNGETWKVIWTVAGEKTVGTAIGNDDVLSIGYPTGDGNSGVALLVRDGAKWDGIWAYRGAEATGTETWIKR